jgi:ribonuclease HII
LQPSLLQTTRWFLPGPRSHRCGFWYEKRAREAGYQRIAGVDEVGRGALFGSVVAAAVILDLGSPIRGLQDSKRLSAKVRERLAGKIRQRALAWSIASVEPTEIDRINIYQASRLAMRQAVLTLEPPPDLVLVDALRLDLALPQVAIIHGDSLSVSIAAASIVAKVERDALMQQWDQVYPQYGLARNKGYATAAHREALSLTGPSPLHRYSYAPVSSLAAWFPVTQEPLFGPGEAKARWVEKNKGKDAGADAGCGG